MLFWLAGGLVLLMGVGVVDYFTRHALAMSLFYLVPILMLSWYVGLWAGLLALTLTGLDLFMSVVLRSPESDGSLLPYWNAGLELLLFVMVIYLTRTLKVTLDRERSLARTDHGTGALNARAFEEFARQEIKRVARSGRPFTVAFADLDDFKSINDRFGHPAGDQVLRTVADTIRRNVRASDVLARMGGDEFALLLPECWAEVATEVLTRLHHKIQAAVGEGGVPATLSVGAATFMTPPQSYEAMISLIDELMYEAKRAGKNGFRHQTVP